VDDKGVYHSEDRVFILDMRVRLIVGVNPPEREEKQDVVINLSMWSLPSRASSSHDYVPRAYNYRTIARMVTDLLEPSSFKTIEAMASEVAKLVVTQCHVRRVTVRVNKPSALLFASSAGVEIIRDASHYGGTLASFSSISSSPSAASSSSAGASQSATRVASKPSAALTLSSLPRQHIVFLALGSNLGDRAANINLALERLASSFDCAILDTSFLYETPPAYVTDQPMFLNAVCKVLQYILCVFMCTYRP